MLIKHRMDVQVQGSGLQAKRITIGNTFGFGARRGGGAETLP
jgi:FAD synthase